MYSHIIWQGATEARTAYDKGRMKPSQGVRKCYPATTVVVRTRKPSWKYVKPTHYAVSRTDDGL